MGKQWKQYQTFIFLGSKITADYVYSHEIKRCLLLGRKAMTNLVNILKSRDITDKGPSSQSYDFSSNHVWMWELDHKESWMLNNWCFWIVVLEKTLESLLVFEEIKPDNPKGNQSWISIEKTNGEAKVPMLWPPMYRTDSLEKTLMLGKTGLHHQLNGHELEQALGFGDGQGSLASCSPWDHTQSDMTEH